jgi:hypothetical protein
MTTGSPSASKPKERHLTLAALRNKIAVERDEGGLVYIKERSASGEPLNFAVRGSTATSGKWRNGLGSRPISWVLVYHRVNRNRRTVWVGDYVKSTAEADRYVIHLSNLAGPLDVDMSLHKLVGKREPQNPIFLAFKSKKATPIQLNRPGFFGGSK